MSIRLLKRIGLATSLSLLGVLVGLAGLYLAFHQRRPAISFEITNEANVLDVRTPLKDLQISFQGEDIQQKNLNLRILTIRIENSGEIDILQNYFDRNDTWGFGIKNGKIVEVRLLASNSIYVQSNLHPQLINSNTVALNKIIFDRGKFFILEVLVLHPKDKSIAIVPIGKIAGIDAIVPIKSYMQKGGRPFLDDIIQGSIVVHIARFILYVVGFILLVFVVAGIGTGVASITERRQEKLSKRLTESFAATHHIKEGSPESIPLDLYRRYGLGVLRSLQALLDDREELLATMRGKMAEREFQTRLKELGRSKRTTTFVGPRHYIVQSGTSRDVDVEFVSPSDPRSIVEHVVIPELLERGILTLNNNAEVQVSNEFRRTLEEFLVHLQSSYVTKRTKSV